MFLIQEGWVRMISIPILQMRKPLFGEICAFRVSQGFFGGLVKYLPAMWGTWVRSLGQEDSRRREWLPTVVSLPGKSQRQRSLACYSPWGCRVGQD